MDAQEKSPVIEPDNEKQIVENDRKGSIAASLDEALGELDISAKDADEAFAFLKNHPNADHVRQEAVAILMDDKATKRLRRKIDFTIVPCMIAVYCEYSFKTVSGQRESLLQLHNKVVQFCQANNKAVLQYLDKTTISYTAVMGLRTDTHLHGQDYSNIAMMFYVGFLAAEFPTQYLAQRISRLGKYLGANVMLWGVILSCMAATTSYAGLMICRTLLGIFEAPVAPILVLIIAMWYKKNEQGRRVVGRVSHMDIIIVLIILSELLLCVQQYHPNLWFWSCIRRQLHA
jgi:MFS transporter, ACS family, allantoate permease